VFEEVGVDAVEGDELANNEFAPTVVDMMKHPMI